MAPPFKQAEFDIMYGKGISREGSLLDVGVDLGIVKKSGAWFTYEGEQLGQGRENAKKFLAENPEIMVEISERVRPGGRPRRATDADVAPTSPTLDADVDGRRRVDAEQPIAHARCAGRRQCRRLRRLGRAVGSPARSTGAP